MNRTKDAQAHPTVQQLLSHLRADSRSSSEIARLTSVSQPTISRMRHSDGSRQRITKSFNKLCNFYNVPLVTLTNISQDYNELLQEAIIDAWDGTEAGAQALLVVIRGLKGLNKKTGNAAGELLDHT
jgi:transcriptional regulator with XRE-family HTH domain